MARAELLSAADPGCDRDWLLEVSGGDPHFFPEYLSAYESIVGRPMVFVYSSALGRVQELMLVRALPASLSIAGADAISGYPFGGPIARPDSSALYAAADQALAGVAGECGIVSMFRRYHPLRPVPATAISAAGLVRRDCYGIDLTSAEDLRFVRLSGARRRNVATARQSGVTIARTPFTPADVPAFSKMYLDTMDRRLAGESYRRLAGPFLVELCRAMPANLSLIQARVDGVTVAAAVFIESPLASYYFLGEWDDAFSPVRPNDLLFWEASCSAAARGAQWLVLGGGVRSGDGLARYKASFGATVLPWAVTGMTFLPDAFDRLVAAPAAQGEASDNGGYFPRYRSHER